MLIAAGGVAAAESGPGEPFYRVRLDAEALFLPPPGSDARLTADLDRAQARLAEAQQAASSGNWNAEADALGAYSEVVGSMALSGTPTNLEAAETRLRSQLENLVRLQSGAGGDAPAGVSRAIDEVDALLGRAPATPGQSAAPTHGVAPSADHGPSDDPGSSGTAGSGASTTAGPSGEVGPKASPSPAGPGGSSDSGAGGPSPSPSSRPSGAGSESSTGSGQGGRPSDQPRGG
jgi:hypothetical protein